MSIEDINYLKSNSIKQSYTFLIDSSSRNRKINPHPSECTVEFSAPFKNVIGIEVLDVSVPKAMYNIDFNNNRFYFYISKSDKNDLSIDENGNYNESLFSFIDISPGDYTTSTFIEKVRLIFFQQNIDLDMNSVDTPAELSNLIYFQSSNPFVLDVKRSTLSEILGFDEYVSNDTNNNKKYQYKEYNSTNGCEQLFHSLKQSNGSHKIISPGMLYLLNNKYIIMKCPEIENHLYRSLPDFGV